MERKGRKWKMKREKGDVGKEKGQAFISALPRLNGSVAKW